MARILIIDDSRLSTSALTNILIGIGHQIVANAFNGEDGLVKAKETNPGVVCLDFVMPGIDGKETALKLREILPNVKIVMITQDKVAPELKSEIKALAYIVKPITASKIKEAFARV